MDGEVSELELKISQVLFELAKKHRGLERVSFKRAVDGGSLVGLIVGHGQIPFVVGRGGRIAQELERHLKTKVRVIEEWVTARKLVQDVLAPADVLGVNILYTKAGDEYHVRVPRTHLRRLPGKVNDLQNLLEKITHKRTVITFE